jgi:hypothetical protein
MKEMEISFFFIEQTDGVVGHAVCVSPDVHVVVVHMHDLACHVPVRAGGFVPRGYDFLTACDGRDCRGTGGGILCLG